MHHLIAATAAFVVGVTNNFWWNRHWTFRAGAGRAGFQAPRFFTVSVVAFLFAAAVLELLVSVVGVAELPAQAIAIVAATPLNFIGNKMWSFASRSRATDGALVVLARSCACWSRPPPRPDPEAPALADRAAALLRAHAREVERIASRADKVREARRDGPLDPTAYTRASAAGR